jgi:hypothetical protein
MEMNMPPRWGFSSFGVGGYNDVAPPELKNGSSATVRTTALIQWQEDQGEGEPGSDCMGAAKLKVARPQVFRLR